MVSPLPRRRAALTRSLDSFRVVLVEPTHPGNIGATARAMKTMGLTDLALVRPAEHLASEAYARAAGADDILEGARVCATVEEALVGASLVVGTSARRRRNGEDALPVRRLAAVAAAEPGEASVAVLFGTERVGLSNEDLARCRHHMVIPTDPAFWSLNLASAVQIVCYELRMAVTEARPLVTKHADEPASAEELDYFFEHLFAALTDLGFFLPGQENRPHLELRFRRMFTRMAPDKYDMGMLRGWLTRIQQAVGTRGSRRPGGSSEAP
ncbi:MAG: RNA methyltransferase [Deltaproteobacteria bacterium]|nr:RNA methyltransferase [Deltaproteobacteria bacterium]